MDGFAAVDFEFARQVLQRGSQGFEQLVVVPGLHDEIGGAGFEGANGGAYLAVGRNHDDRGSGGFFLDAPQPV